MCYSKLQQSLDNSSFHNSKQLYFEASRISLHHPIKSLLNSMYKLKQKFSDIVNRSNRAESFYNSNFKKRKNANKANGVFCSDYKILDKFSQYRVKSNQRKL